jgi:hypothetical protein
LLLAADQAELALLAALQVVDLQGAAAGGQDQRDGAAQEQQEEGSDTSCEC